MAGKSSFTVELLIGARDKASRVLVAVRRQLNQLSGTAVAAAAGITAAFAGAVGGLSFATSIKSAADFEVAMDRVAAKSGATGKDLAALEKAASDMGATTRYTATEAANGLEILSAAGLKAQESITALPSVLNLATAAGIGLADSASLVVATLTQFKRPIEEAAKVADVLAKASTLADTTISEMGNALSYAGSEAETNGQRMEQTAAALDVLAGSAIKGERAGTALRNILGNLNDPTSKLREALRAVGIDTGNMTIAFEQLSRKTGPDVQKVLGAIDAESRSAARALIEGSSKAAAFVKDLENAEGAAGKMAKTMGDNLTGSLKGLQSAWDSVARFIIDQNFLDLLRSGVDDVTAAFRRAVSDGSLTAFRDGLREMTSSGIDSIRRFVAEFDFKQALASLSGFIDRSIGLMQGLATATTIATSTIKAAWYGFKGTIETIAAGWANIIAVILGGLNTLIQGMNKVGLVSDQTARSFENFTQAFIDAAAEYEKAADESFSKAADSLSSSTDRMGRSIEQTTNQAEDLASGMEDAALRINQVGEALRAGAEDLDATAQEMAAAFIAIEDQAAAGAREIEQTFIAALARIETPAELQALQDALDLTRFNAQAAGESTAQLEQLQAALDIRAKTLAVSINATTAATEGLTDAQDQVAESAKATGSAFEQAKAELARVRDIYNTTAARVRELEQAEREGADVAQDLADARRDQANAQAAYAGALAKVVVESEKETDSLQQTNDLAARAVDAKIAQAQASAAVARATGNEAAETRALQKVKDLEAQQAKIIADGKKAEAAAAAALLPVLREQAAAATENKEAILEELQAAERNAQAKAIEADIATANAKAKRAEAKASRDSAAASKEQAAAQDVAASATEETSKRSQVLSRSLIAAEKSAKAATDAIKGGADGAGPAVGRLNAAWETLQGNIRLVERLSNRSITASSPAFAARVRELSGLRDRLNDVARATESLADGFHEGTLTAGDLSRAASIAASMVGRVGEADLQPLRDQIATIRDEMRRLQEASEDTLTALREKLLDLQDDQAALQQLRYEQQRLEIEQELQKAKAIGDKQSIDNLTEALRILEQVNQEERARLKEKEKQHEQEKAAERDRETARQREREHQERTGRGGSGSGSGGSATAGSSVSSVEVGNAVADALSRAPLVLNIDGEALVGSIVRRLQRDARRSN